MNLSSSPLFLFQITHTHLWLASLGLLLLGLMDSYSIVGSSSVMLKRNGGLREGFFLLRAQVLDSSLDSVTLMLRDSRHNNSVLYVLVSSLIK